MKCPNCGMGSEVSSPYCPRCGAETRTPRRSDASRAQCSKCGHENEADAKFCDNCGLSLVNGGVTGQIEEARPYLEWEGWPFATLEKRTQTEDQWFLTVLVGSVVVFIVSLALIASHQECLAVVFILFVFVMGILAWRAGRRGAQG